MSERREMVYQYIRRHIAENGWPPSVREISAGCGLRSTSAAQAHLQALVREGRITRLPFAARAIAIVAERSS